MANSRELVVFVEGSFEVHQVDRISGVRGVRATFFTDRATMAAEIPDAEVVAGRLDAQMLGAASRLKWVQSWAAGPDEALFPEMVESPVLLTSCKGNGAVPLAEHALLLMLMLNRNAVRWVDAQRDHRWDRFTHGELSGLTCGIIGLGNSGSDLALKAQAFHMQVLGIRRKQEPVRGVDELLPPDGLGDLLRRSDFVVVTAPRTTETSGLLGEPQLKMMKPTAHLICFSRGGIVDDDALLRALEEGWIAGAGLDAHGEEPLQPNSPFWTARNTIVTPHNGATTHGTRERSVDIFVDNLERFVAGRPLHNLVDKLAGY